MINYEDIMIVISEDENIAYSFRIRLYEDEYTYSSISETLIRGNITEEDNCYTIIGRKYNQTFLEADRYIDKKTEEEYLKEDIFKKKGRVFKFKKSFPYLTFDKEDILYLKSGWCQKRNEIKDIEIIINKKQIIGDVFCHSVVDLK